MESKADRGLVNRIGPVEIDWPRAVGYYGGLGLAVGFGMIEPPFGIFIAAVPLFKMLNRPQASRPVRLVSQIMDGAAQPVGGDGDPAIKLVATGDRVATSIVGEARLLADRVSARRQRGTDGRRTRAASKSPAGM
ncbi:MAG: hypothetical protein M3008_06965 [Chloroflexota bacterium]|nr:hypothetical protein [Chloroflexota bacterium]